MSDVDWASLQETLPKDAVEWRIQQSGESNGRPWARVVPYPDARWLMDRLDDVVGPPNWRTDFIAGPAGGVICSLSIRVGDEWISKEDGAENTDIESVKGGLTDAFKRACVVWNVGGIRALYRVSDCWANIHEGGRYNSKINGQRLDWDPPEIELSNAGATVSHKRNGKASSGGAKDETLDAIGEAMNELRGWNQEKADEIAEWYGENKEKVEGSQDRAEKVLDRLNRRIEEAKDEVEAATEQKEAL